MSKAGKYNHMKHDEVTPGSATKGNVKTKNIVLIGMPASGKSTNAIHVKHVRKIDMTEALKNRE